MNELKGKIQTVTGLIAPEDLGPTTMHEHIVADFSLPEHRGLPEVEITLENRYELDRNWVDTPGIRRMTDHEIAAKEVGLMVEAGGKSIVDVSTSPMIIFPERLREVSERTGAQIIMGCGRYAGDFMAPSDFDRSVDDLVEEFVGHIREGFDGTGIKSGLIGEIGCNWPWIEAERRSVHAAVITQQETGAALSIHPPRHPQGPFEVLDFLKETGADLTRTVMDHNERRLFDAESYLRMAESGIILEFDMFGLETSFFAQAKDVDLSSDGARLTWIRTLLDHGHGDQVVVGHDICQRTRQVTFGGHGLGHIFRNIVPMMSKRGFDEGEIQAILVETPKRLLTFV